MGTRHGLGLKGQFWVLNLRSIVPSLEKMILESFQGQAGAAWNGGRCPCGRERNEISFIPNHSGILRYLTIGMQQDGHGCATALPQAQENRARNRRLGLAVKNSWKRLILPGWRWQGGDGALPGWCRSDERLDFKGKEPDPANNPRLFPVWPSRPRSRGFCSLTRSRERRSPAAASRECRCQPHPNLL